MPKFILAVVIVLALLFVVAEGGEKTAKKSEKPAKKGLMELKLELPEPKFGKTPERIEGINNLEPPQPKKRPAFYVPTGTVNLARGKKVTASDDLPIMGDPKLVTDGDNSGFDISIVELAPGKQWVQIDLGKQSTIYAVVIWRNFSDPRVYKDVVVRVADDKEMKKNAKTIFNTDDDNSSKLGTGKDMSYIETNKGKIINARGVKGRYIRLYSNGNTSDDMNHYCEVEVYGKQ